MDDRRMQNAVYSWQRLGMACWGSTTRTTINPWASAAASAACAASPMCVYDVLFFTSYEKNYRGFDVYMLEILRND